MATAAAADPLIPRSELQQAVQELCSEFGALTTAQNAEMQVLKAQVNQMDTDVRTLQEKLISDIEKLRAETVAEVMRDRGVLESMNASHQQKFNSLDAVDKQLAEATTRMLHEHGKALQEARQATGDFGGKA